MKNSLTLNKKTIAKLSENQLTTIKGGRNDSKSKTVCRHGSCTQIKTHLSL